MVNSDDLGPFLERNMDGLFDCEDAIASFSDRMLLDGINCDETVLYRHQ